MRLPGTALQGTAVPGPTRSRVDLLGLLRSGVFDRRNHSDNGALAIRMRRLVSTTAQSIARQEHFTKRGTAPSQSNGARVYPRSGRRVPLSLPPPLPKDAVAHAVVRDQDTKGNPLGRQKLEPGDDPAA